MKARTKQTLKIYLKHIRQYPYWLALAIGAVIMANLVDAIVPLLFKKFFNLLSEGNLSLAGNVQTILFQYLGLSLLAWIFWRLGSVGLQRLESKGMRDIVNTCFKYLHGHSFAFFSNNFAGTLVRRVNKFERSYEIWCDTVIWEFCAAGLRLLFILIILANVSLRLAAVLAVWVVLYLAINIAFARYKLKYDLEYTKADTQATGRLADTIGNNLNLKLFGGAKYESKTFSSLTEKLYQARLTTWSLSEWNSGIQSFLMLLLNFVMLWVAVLKWQEGELTIGDFALIQAYVTLVFARLWDLGRHIKKFYEALADAEEMTVILNTPHEVEDQQSAKSMNIGKGEIEFSDVTFYYNEKRNIFKNFNLTIQPGEKVALIGPSGGGKTTIVKLLFRFFDLKGGKIVIDGQDISRVTQESLRGNIALVPQEPILFHRSLMENIRYARQDATDKEVYAASKAAHCHEFISQFPEGYETYVGERGIKLSGGERQRVAIARAILKDAPILVLDEATSSLDSESEMFIQDALKNLMQGKTTIVIAHRLSTIMQMDRIIVLENGKITEEGKHQELLKAKQGTYQKLWQIQAGGFAK